MENLKPESAAAADNSSEIVSEPTISLGSIVTTHAHPFHFQQTTPLVTTYANLTPPLMIVVEVKKGRKYDAETGEKEVHTYKCIYYSTKGGQFVECWFRKHELKLIATPDSTINDEKKETLAALKKKYLGTAVTLKSVDLELGKKNIWTNSTETKTNWKQNNLLDFLPPLATVIDVKYLEHPHKHDEKDGLPIHEKSTVVYKIRWMNNTTSKFSEEELPGSALRLVQAELTLEPYEVGSVYLYQELINLEDRPNLGLKKTPVTYERVVWKHYYYVYYFRNVFTNQTISLRSKNLKKISKIVDTSPTDVHNILFSLDFKENSGILEFPDKSLVENKWFEIQYLDRANRFTKRIIFITTVEEMGDSEDKPKVLILKANCLLREGKIRHFNADRILRYRELPEVFFASIK